MSCAITAEPGFEVHTHWTDGAHNVLTDRLMVVGWFVSDDRRVYNLTPIGYVSLGVTLNPFFRFAYLRSPRGIIYDGSTRYPDLLDYTDTLPDSVKAALSDSNFAHYLRP